MSHKFHEQKLQIALSSPENCVIQNPLTLRQWSMKQERRTPGYTTDWDGLALVRA